MARIVKKPDERRSELIACAQKLFYSQGYESTSVRDIVNEAGVAKGTFYYYFDSKQAVLEAMVDELIAYSLAMMRDIIEDESLDARTKWVRAMAMVGNWKLERRAELLALVSMLQKDENALLQDKLRTKTIELVAPELARIVRQGAEEGVFETGYVNETAEIALVIMQTLSLAIADMISRPHDYADPVNHARLKLEAVQTAIERVLGAAPGSLPLMDWETLAVWIDGDKAPVTERVS